MVRPIKERAIEKMPPVLHYKPAGVPLREMEETILTIDEMEAIRLADIEQLDQAAAAERMEISAPTFNRMVNTAHQKIAAALWQGNALRVEGGNFRVAQSCRNTLRQFVCRTCGNKWALPYGTGHRGRDLSCPSCGAATVSRDKEEEKE